MTGSFGVVAMLRVVLKEFHTLMVNKYRFPLLPEALTCIGLRPSPCTVALPCCVRDGDGDGVRATLRLVVLLLAWAGATARTSSILPRVANFLSCLVALATPDLGTYRMSTMAAAINCTGVLESVL